MSITPGGVLQGVTALRTGKIGAGGFTTGLDIAADGTKIVRTDTFNAWTLEVGATQWQQCLKPGVNCNASDIDLYYGGDPHPWGQCGTYDAVIALSNSAVRYIVCMGYVWVTQNSGTLWTRCALAQKAGCLPNEANRMSGRPLAVDPQNPAVVWFGCPSGVFWSADYGANWTSVSTATLPVPTAGTRYCIAFDPNSIITSTKKQGIYIFINGTGLRKSVDAGASWTTPTQPTNIPTAASHLKVGSNGYVYLTGDGAAGTGRFRRWNGTAWLEPVGAVCKPLAISPFTAGLLYAGGAGGGLMASSDYGATWTPDGTNAVPGGPTATTTTRVATSIGWQSYTKEDFMTNGDYAFDPLVNTIWCAEGCGVWKTVSPPTTIAYSTTFSWIEYSNGIENMVSSLLAINAIGDVGYSMHDRGMMVIPRANVGVLAPSSHGADNTFNLGGTDIQPIPGDNNSWVGVSLGKGIGKTANKGGSWTLDGSIMTASGGAGGGNIVVFDANNWLIVQTNRAFPLAGQSGPNGVWRTSNAGTSWTKCTIGDNEALNFHASYGYARKVLIGDAYATGTAYAYNMGDSTGSASDLACKGIWKTTDYGVTWSRVKNGFIISAGADGFRGQFKQVGVDDWLWSASDESLGLYRSTNGMASWTAITGTDNVNGSAGFGEVFAVAVGKAHPTSSYKTLAAMGWRQVTPALASSATGWGFWASIDNGASWVRWDQFPGGIFDCPLDMAADPLKYGRFYIAWGGTGMSLYDINDVRNVT